MAVNFNPRSREGSDTYAGSRFDHHRNFNPRSREGSDYKRWRDIDEQNNFNPRSREGSDERGKGQKVVYRISIHAPARGATPCTHLHSYIIIISIHAPARGATLDAADPLDVLPEISIHAPARGATYNLRDAMVYLVFQSTLPRGERRRSSSSLFICASFQSPLPRGERRRSYYPVTFFLNFNPRSREGSD